MLCDSWLAQIHAFEKAKMPGYLPAAPGEPSPIETLKRAQRFVLAPDAVRVVDALADDLNVERVRHAAVAPADETWIEWADAEYGQIGVLLYNVRPGAPATYGDGIVLVRARTLRGDERHVPLPVRWNLLGPGAVVELSSNDSTCALVRQAFPGFFERLDLKRVGIWLVAMFSLIAAPRLITLREPDFGRLNKKRRRLGRAEFLPHREITLALDPEAASNDRAEESEDRRVGRALHHVRAHYRLIPGAVTLVRQHWRGDARFGTTKQRHTIRNQSDRLSL